MKFFTPLRLLASLAVPAVSTGAFFALKPIISPPQQEVEQTAEANEIITVTAENTGNNEQTQTENQQPQTIQGDDPNPGQGSSNEGNAGVLSNTGNGETDPIDGSADSQDTLSGSSSNSQSGGNTKEATKPAETPPTKDESGTNPEPGTNSEGLGSSSGSSSNPSNQEPPNSQGPTGDTGASGSNGQGSTNKDTTNLNNNEGIMEDGMSGFVVLPADEEEDITPPIEGTLDLPDIDELFLINFFEGKNEFGDVTPTKISTGNKIAGYKYLITWEGTKYWIKIYPDKKNIFWFVHYYTIHKHIRGGGIKNEVLKTNNFVVTKYTRTVPDGETEQLKPTNTATWKAYVKQLRDSQKTKVLKSLKAKLKELNPGTTEDTTRG